MLRALADRLAEAGAVRDAERLYRRLLEREELGSTALGSGTAVPHCKLKKLDRVVVAVGLSRQAIDFGGEAGPVRAFFLVVSPEGAPAEHLRALAAISQWIKTDHHVERLLELTRPAAIYELLRGGTDE